MATDDPFAGLDDAVAATMHQTTGTTTTLRNNVVNAVGMNPDQEAGYKHLAQFTGVPVDTVRADPAPVRQQAAVQSMDATKLAQQYPHLAQFMQDQQNVNIMHDDVPATAAVEQAASAVPAPPIVHPTGASVTAPVSMAAMRANTGDSGDSVIGLGNLAYAGLQGLGGVFNKAGTAVNIVAGAFPTAYDWLTNAFVPGPDSTKASDWWFNHMVAPSQAAAPAFQLPKDAGFPSKAAHTAGSLLGTLSQIVLTGGGGEAAAPALTMPSTAGVVGVAVEHGTKAMAFPALSDAVNTGQDVYAQTGDGMAAARAAQAQYVSSTLGGIVPLSMPGGLATRLLGGFASGAATSEASREIMNSANPASMQQPFNAQDFILGGLTGSIMGGAMGPHAEPSYHDAIRQTYVDAAQADAAVQAGQAMQALGQMSAASKLRERDPAAFQQLVQSITEDGHLQDLYVSAHEVQNALDQSGVPDGELAAKMPDLAGQMHEALQTNGDVRIPVADYATHIAGGPLEAALMPHMKAGPDAPTFREGQDYFQNQKADMQAQAAQIMQDKAADDEHTAQVQAVYDHVLGQLNTANRFSPDVNKAYASMMRDFYTTTAARAGLTPAEMLERYPIQVRTDALEGAKTLEQGTPDSENFKNWFDGSQVTNKDGNPLVVYHGTNADFSQFKHESIGSSFDSGKLGEGFYFSADPSLAGSYANLAKAKTKEDAANIMPVHLSLKNPFEINAKDGLWSALAEKSKALGVEQSPTLDENKTPNPEWSAAFKKALENEGHDGVVLHFSDGRDEYVAFDPEQIKSAIGNKGTFDPNSPNILDQTKRGSISFGDDITQQPSVINLLKDADLSTFLHESGHFFLEVMHDLAARPDAPADIRADMSATLKWMGVSDIDTWGKMTLEEKREAHEQFARGFEAYLMEGKAPSTALQPLFSRFRSWLMNVYQSLTGLHVELTPGVRQVFDRMLASSEAIKEAEQTRGYAPVFETAEGAGMTPDAFEAYKQLGASATDAAISDMQTRSLKDMKWLSGAKSRAIRAMQKDAAAKRIAIKDQVTEEVMAEPVNQARAFLNRKGNTDPIFGKAEKTWQDARAARAAADLAEVKTETWDKSDEAAAGQKGIQKGQFLMRNKRAMDNEAERRTLAWENENPKPQRPKGQMPPDMVAEMFGFADGKALKQAMAGESAKDKIAGITDQRMLEQHGELTDAASIERAAEDAVHNEGRARFMATGLKILTKSPIPARQIERAAKEAAEGAVAAKKVSDLRPAQYAAAEGRNNKDAIKLAPKDPAGAAAAQRAALLNNRLFRATIDAVAETAKTVKFMARFSKDSIRAKMDVDVRDQIDNLLERFDFRQKVPDGPTRAQTNLQTWVESQRKAGYTPTFTADMIDPTVRMHFKDMTVEQLRGLRDTVAALEHIGKARHTMLVDGERVSVDSLVKDEMVPKMQERGDNFTEAQLLEDPAERRAQMNVFAAAVDKFTAKLRGWQAQLKPTVFKQNMFDMHEILGPFARSMFDRVANANYDKVRILRGLSDDFQEAVKKLAPDWQKSLHDVVPNDKLLDPDKTGNPPMLITRGKMIGIAIHVGNESNFDKMTKGWGFTPEDVWSFLHDNMTHDDWKAARAVGDAYEKHFPEAQAMDRRLGNTAVSKIEPRPFMTKFGEMPGWYAAIRYDPLRSRRGEKESAGTAIDPSQGVFKGDYFRQDTTTNGSMNARIDGYTDRVDLGYEHIARVLHDSIHDLAYREALIDVNKIIEHPVFRQQFKKTYGPEAYQSLRDWIGQTANSENFDRQAGDMGKFLASTRTGIVITGIAFRASTVLKHGGSAGIKTAGYFLGGGEKYLAARGALMATDYRNQIAGAQEKFGEIRARLLQQDRDFKVTAAGLFEPESLKSKAERYGHAAVAWSDMMTAVPTAWAAYDRAITEGIPVRQGGTGMPMTEEQAINYANKTVREAHGSNIETARSMALNTSSEALKMFTTMYGFMNTSYGQALDGWDKLQTAGIGKPEVLARTTMALIMPALWAAALTSGAPNKDNWASWLGKAITGEVAGMVPFVRDAYSMFEGYSHAGQVGAESWLEAMVQASHDVYKLAKGQPVKAPIKDIANAAGMSLHIPGLGQLGTSMQYLADVHAGKQPAPKGPGEALKNVLLGPTSKH